MLLTVKCGGDNWQADFEPLIPRLEGFFKRCFRDWPDKEEEAWNALLLFMEGFSRKWKQGETITMTTVFVMRDVCGDRKPFVPRKQWIRSVPAATNHRRSLAKLKAKEFRAASWADYNLLWEQLPERERRAVQMAVEGYTLNEIAKAIRADYRTVRQYLYEAVGQLLA